MKQGINFEIEYARKPKVKIMSVGTYFPEQIVTSDDLFEEIKSVSQYQLPVDWMSRHIGIKERRMAEDWCKPSDLAIPAAREALEKCDGLELDDIGLVIFCGIERDQPEPATAHTIQNALGLKAPLVFDIANACYGFVNGIQVAIKFIESGAVGAALVVTGEVPTKVTRSVVELLKSGIELEKARGLIGALTVGDAGGAVVLGAAMSSDEEGFTQFLNSSDSSHIQKCIYKRDEHGVPVGQMQMQAINTAIYDSHETIIDDTLQKLQWVEFDWVLLHQTGGPPFERLASLNGVVRDRMVKSFDIYGNITTATFPVNFNILENNGKVRAGDKIGGCFAGSGITVGQFGYTY